MGPEVGHLIAPIAVEFNFQERSFSQSSSSNPIFNHCLRRGRAQ
jgi:hypothetical protein